MPEQKSLTPQQGESSESGTENKKGLSKEAWTAISAIAVELIKFNLNHTSLPPAP
jgi:hypothetical protein